MRNHHCLIEYAPRIASMLLVSVLIAAATTAYARESVKRDCTTDSEQRIANLLGCCGDVSQSYAGTEVERMTAAIDAIAATKREGCMNQESPEYLEVLLDQAGAYLARARARTSEERDQHAIIGVLSDTNKSVAIIEAFSLKHPKEASLVWYWIATALQKAGRPWMALEFVSMLDPHCCKQDQINEVRGELLFELGIYDAASRAYSAWLSQSSDYYCGHSVSLSDAATLRHHGFSIPEVDEGPQENCFVLSGWVPYVRFPRR
jgi:tetratricopeptide (TPR) repeat protein